MKKYRCPKCGEYFEGEQANCPHCGIAMKYRHTVNIEQEIKQEVAENASNKFNFHGSGVVFHPDNIFDEDKYEDIHNETPEEAAAEKEREAANAPEHFEEMVLEDGKSYFDGNALERFGWNLLEIVITLGTAFIGFPWAMCMRYRWETKHTVINGRRLCFDGTGGQLFGRFLLWLVLSVLTLGLYGIGLTCSVQQWKTKHTHFLTPSGEKI